MFKCGNCKTDTLPGQPVNYVVLEKRPASYDNIIVRGPDRGGFRTTDGYETVKEIKACPACYGTLTGLEAKIADPKPQPIKQVEKTNWKPRRDQGFNKPRPIDKTNPNWKHKQELDEIKRREGKSTDPRGNIERKKPIVEVVSKLQRH